VKGSKTGKNMLSGAALARGLALFSAVARHFAANGLDPRNKLVPSAATGEAWPEPTPEPAVAAILAAF